MTQLITKLEEYVQYNDTNESNIRTILSKIKNQEQLEKKEVLEILDILCKRMNPLGVDLAELVKCDSEKLIEKSFEKYIESQESKIINQFGRKSIELASLKETYLNLVSLIYGNSEIICSFGNYTRVLGVSGSLGINLTWEVLEETSDGIGDGIYLEKEEVEAVIKQIA